MYLGSYKAERFLQHGLFGVTDVLCLLNYRILLNTVFLFLLFFND